MCMLNVNALLFIECVTWNSGSEYATGIIMWWSEQECVMHFNTMVCNSQCIKSHLYAFFFVNDVRVAKNKPSTENYPSPRGVPVITMTEMKNCACGTCLIYAGVPREDLMGIGLSHDDSPARLNHAYYMTRPGLKRGLQSGCRLLPEITDVF